MQKTDVSPDAVSTRGVSGGIDSIHKKGLTRRNFLKTSAFVAGTAAAASSFGCSVSEVASTTDTSNEIQTFTGRCMWGGCQICKQEVSVRNGKVIKVDTVLDEARRNRPCLRGRAQVQRINNPARLQYPMKRVGERGSGEWEQISWDEAIETITSTWKRIMDEYGNQAVACYSGAGTSGFLSVGLAGRLINIMQFTKFDSCVDLAVCTGISRVFGGSGYYYPVNETMDNLNYSKYIFVWGQNTTESIVQNYRWYLDAQEHGAQVIVIDPIKSSIAGIADQWYPIRPGSDTALMLAMINVIVEEELHDVEFLKSVSNGTYLVKTDTMEVMRMSDLGVKPTEGPINMMTGQPTIIDPGVAYDLETESAVDAALVKDPALSGSWTIEGKKVTTAFDLLVEQAKPYTPEMASELCDMDPEIIRKLARMAADGPVEHTPSMGAQSYNNGVQYGFAMAVLIAVTGQIGKLGTGIMSSYYPGMPVNPLYTNPTGTYASYVPILKFPDIMNEGTWRGQPYPVKAIYCFSGNFLSGCVEVNKIKEVLDDIELLVTADLSFTDTVNYSDIILPAAHNYESWDIHQSPPVRELLYTEKCVEPPFECKPDAEITRLFADKLGISEYFGTDEEMMEVMLDSPQFKEWGLTLPRLRETTEMRWGEMIVAHEDGIYETESGKIQVFCDNPRPRIDWGQDYDVVAEKLPYFIPPTEAWPESEAAQKYPIILFSERARNRLQTVGFDIPWFFELEPEPTIRLSAEDAAERGIVTDDYVEIFNDRGSVVAKAQISSCVRPGISVYPKGLQASQFISKTSFSELSSMVFDPLGVNSSFFDAMVEVRKWDGEE